MVSKHKDSLEKHALAPRSPQHQAKQSTPPPSPLQERPPEPEKNSTSDDEDTSGHSKSAKGQVLGTRSPLEGEELECKETVQLVTKKVTQEVGDTSEGVKTNVHHKEKPPRDDASTKLACEMLECGDGDLTAALVPGALQTFPRQKEGGLGNALPSPPSSQIVECSGQSITKLPLVKNKLDCENNTSEWEESLHKSKKKSSKSTESRKVKGKCPEVGMGEKQEGQEFKSQLQRAVKPSRTDWQLETGHMRKPSKAKGLSDAKEKNHVSETRSWGDSMLLASDSYKKSKGARDSSLRPPGRHSSTLARAAGTVRAAPPGGRGASAFEDEALQDKLSDHEFRILEEEILAWEKVHLENEVVALLLTCFPVSENCSLIKPSCVCTILCSRVDRSVFQAMERDVMAWASQTTSSVSFETPGRRCLCCLCCLCEVKKDSHGRSNICMVVFYFLSFRFTFIYLHVRL